MLTKDLNTDRQCQVSNFILEVLEKQDKIMQDDNWGIFGWSGQSKTATGPERAVEYQLNY
jgi:hypothetical protein